MPSSEKPSQVRRPVAVTVADAFSQDLGRRRSLVLVNADARLHALHALGPDGDVIPSGDLLCLLAMIAGPRAGVPMMNGIPQPDQETIPGDAAKDRTPCPLGDQPSPAATISM